MAKIIIVALALLVIMLSGCVDDYAGTYTSETATLVLFSDETFSLQDGDRSASGTYKVVDGKIYLNTPLASMSLNITDDKICDNDNEDDCLIKQ